MKNQMTSALCGLFLCTATFCLVQVPKLQQYYTGNTQYLAPIGWTIEAQMQNGMATWQAAKDPADPYSPGILVMVLPNTPGDPRSIVLQLFQPSIPNLQEMDARVISSNEGHFIFQGQSEQGPIVLHSFFLRDLSSNQLFVSSFAASQTDYNSLGGNDLLYRCLRRETPFSEASTPITQNGNAPIVQDPIAEQFGGGLNLQDPNIKRQILQNTASFNRSDLLGEWTQIMSSTTSNVFEDLSTGQLSQGTTGYGHILRLTNNGAYELSYAYHNGPNNQVEVSETGTFSLQGTTLSLNPARYKADYLIYGQAQSENKSSPPARVFQMGLHPSGKYLVLSGAAMEYSITAEQDAYGNNVMLEGFYRTK
ncbi:MAG: lipocalin family protein [Bacteroidota bacterium]